MIRLCRLTVTRGSRSAVKDLSLDIEEGRFYGVLGANGSGKTTLLHCLAGLVPPDHAEMIERDGRFAERMNAGYVIQEPQRQIVFSSVREDVTFGPANLCLSPGIILEQAERWIDALRIRRLYGDDRDTATLSAGQQQTVVLAGISALQPDILLLDEPTSLLDGVQTTLLLDALRRARELIPDITIVCATHDTRLLETADTILVLGEGRLSCLGTREDVLNSPRLAELGVVRRDPNPRIVPSVTPLAAGSVVLTAEKLAACAGTPSRWIFRDVSFQVRAGECLAVLGRNGVGKSLMLDIIGGWHPTDGGTVIHESQNVVGVVLQRCEDALFASSVQEEIEIGIPNGDPVVRRAAADDILGRFGLAHLSLRDVATLSGGERRAVAIAAVVASDPAVLVLDEPFAALDAPARERIRKILLDLKAKGTAILLVTHDLEDVAGIADRFLVFANGGARVIEGHELTSDLMEAAGIISPGNDAGERHVEIESPVTDTAERGLRRALHGSFMAPVRFGPFTKADGACKIACLMSIAIGLQFTSNVRGLAMVAIIAAVILAISAPNVRFVATVLTPFSILLAAVSALQYFTAHIPAPVVLAYALRLFALALFSLIVVMTTPLGEILAGADRLLSPLRKLGVPTRYLSLGIALSIHFLFLFVGMYGDIVKARAARGLRQKGIRGVRSIVLPLVMKLERLIGDVSDSLILRHVNFRNPTILRLRSMSRLSTSLVMVGSGLVLAMAFWQ